MKNHRFERESYHSLFVVLGQIPIGNFASVHYQPQPDVNATTWHD